MSRKVRCTNCRNDMGSLCKLGREEFNTKKSRTCPEFSELEQSPVLLGPAPKETKKVVEHYDNSVIFRFQP